jgi:hypothetical protein
MRMTPFADVTSASLNASPFAFTNPQATQVTSGITLEAPLPQGGGSGVVAYSAASFDTFTAVIPFTIKFNTNPPQRIHLPARQQPAHLDRSSEQCE